MKVVHLGIRFPDDPGHLEHLSQMVDLVVYGTTYHGKPPIQTARVDAKPGKYPPQMPTSCAIREFTPQRHGIRAPLFWTFPGLSSALTEDRPDVIHVISEPWGLLAMQVAAWTRRNRDTALVVHGCDRIWWHGGKVEQALRWTAARWTLAEADGYAGESREAVVRAHSAGLARSIPSTVIHTNPRDAALFRPAHNEAEKDLARRKLGLPLDGIGIGFLGKFIARKGPLLFLDAVSRLRREDSWATIAGGGPLSGDVETRATADGVISLGSLSYPDDVAAFYKAVDVFVVPSWTTSNSSEQGPRAVIEAMLSSCVVVGTACGAIPEMIEDAGVVVKERDPDDLARGIEEATVLATDRAARDRLRRLGCSRYSTISAADQLFALWQASLHVRGRPV